MPEREANPDASRVTVLLEAMDSGHANAASELLPLVYAELRRLAQSRLAKLPPGQTLQPTALVHEAFLRLVGKRDPGWGGRGHFFGAAAQAMRDILVEQSRRKSRLRHGGGRRRIALSAVEPLAPSGDSSRGGLDDPDEALLAVDAVLDRFREKHPRAADVVMYRMFVGLKMDAIAEVLGTSTRTVERDWRFARAWLHRAISEQVSDSGG